MPTRRIAGDIGLAIIGLIVLVWTLLPLYHMFSISITGDGAIFSGRYWPEHPTVENYRKVFTQDHFFLRNVWRQMANSVIAALVSVALVLFIGTMAAFVVSRIRPRWGACYPPRRSSPTSYLRRSWRSPSTASCPTTV
jgi:multiple sugar transport system permease protein